jgi:hypothetical protein
MKFLKNVLLTAGLVVSTMGMSMSANAVLIQQDIFVDVLPGDSFDIGLGLTETLNQLIGSVIYNTDDAYGTFNQIDLDDISIELNLGPVTLTNADVLSGGDAPIELSLAPEVDGIFNFIVNFEFTFNGSMTYIDIETDLDFGGNFFLSDDNGLATIGETRLGVANVSEPSVLIIMLAGMGFLVRRKITTN